jgi:hypothetical protein
MVDLDNAFIYRQFDKSGMLNHLKPVKFWETNT